MAKEVITDNVERLAQWQKRHPGATYHQPLTVAGEHAVTLPDGTREARHDLGWLMDALERLEEGRRL